MYTGLIGQESGLERLTDSIRRNTETTADPADLLIWLSAFGSVVLVIWILAIFSARYREHKPYRSRWGLFLDLAKAQGLRWSECWLLWRLARYHRLKQPGLLFLKPDRFLPRNLPPRLMPKAHELKVLSDRLFSESVQPTPPVEKPKPATDKRTTASQGKQKAPSESIPQPPPIAKPRPKPAAVANNQDDDESPLAGIDFSLPPAATPMFRKSTETSESKPQDSSPSEKGAGCDFVGADPPTLDLPASLFEAPGPTETPDTESPA